MSPPKSLISLCNQRLIFYLAQDNKRSVNDETEETARARKMGVMILVGILFLICMVVYEAGKHHERERADAELDFLFGRINHSNKDKHKNEDD